MTIFYFQGSQCDTDSGQETNDKASDNTSKKKAAEDWKMEYVLVGRELEMNDLRQYTTKTHFDSIQVMFVWGIAGVGKSSLVKNLFCDIILNKQNPHQRMMRSPFSKHGWVDISYPFNLRDFAQSLLLNLHSKSLQSKETVYHDMMGSKNPILECQSILKQHTCLKSTEEWDCIQADLVSVSSKSFIIVITTEERIVKHCHGNKGELVFNVKGLEADSAFQLFKKEVCSILSKEISFNCFSSFYLIPCVHMLLPSHILSFFSLVMRDKKRQSSSISLTLKLCNLISLLCHINYSQCTILSKN